MLCINKEIEETGIDEKMPGDNREEKGKRMMSKDIKGERGERMSGKCRKGKGEKVPGYKRCTGMVK